MRRRTRWAIISVRSCVAFCLLGPDFSLSLSRAVGTAWASLALALPVLMVPLRDAISPVVAGLLLPTSTSTPRSRSERSTRMTTNPDSPVSRSRSPTLRWPSVKATSARSSGLSESRSTACPSGTARIASKLSPPSFAESGPGFMLACCSRPTS